MAAIVPVAMPKLGLTMTEGVLAQWNVAPGDSVTAGDVIFVVETDKISNEIEAQRDGIVVSLHAAEGDVVPVGSIVLSLEADGAESADSGGPLAPAAPPRDDAMASPAPAVRIDAGTPEVASSRVIATPLARRMAAKAGLNLGAIPGSGPRGRIMARDIAAVATQEAGPATDQGTLHALGAYQRVTARRLTEAKRDIPHFYVFAEADVTDLLLLRQRLNADPTHEKLTVTTFLIAAVARTLAAQPPMNRVWAGDSLRELPDIAVGIAVEGEKGLVAPVLHDIGAQALDDIAVSSAALIGRARAGRLTRIELEGGAIAISNVGMFGVTGLLPIINPGQSSIIGVGASQPVFRPDEQGRPALRQILNLSLSCDHRVIDGALAARFLRCVCDHLETPAALLRRPQPESLPCISQ